MSNPHYQSKPIYLECVTLVDHVNGPTAVCLQLKQEFIDRIKTISEGVRALGLCNGEIQGSPGVPAVDHWSETDLFFDCLKINAEAEFMLWGTDRIGARTESRWIKAADLQVALDSPNPVEIGPLTGFDSEAAFVEQLIADPGIQVEDMEALRAAYPAPPASEATARQSLVFQITAEDVEHVLRYDWAAVANTGGRTFEQIAETAFNDLNFFKIERAALNGNDLNTQTRYAHTEIASQLRELGILEPLTEQASPAEQPSNG